MLEVALQAALQHLGVSLPAVLCRLVLPRWVEDRVEESRRESAPARGPVPRFEKVEREPLAADGVVIEGDDL
jgi:hypothetical protein